MYLKGNKTKENISIEISGVFKKWKLGKINEKGNMSTIYTLEVNQYKNQKLLECEYKHMPPFSFNPHPRSKDF